MQLTTLQRDEEPGLRLIYLIGRLAVIGDRSEARWRQVFLKCERQDQLPAQVRATLVAKASEESSDDELEPEPVTETLNLTIEAV